MTKEYEALRAEILEWQSRRIQIMTVSIAFIGGVLGVSQSIQNNISWTFVSVGLLLFLSVASFLTAYCGMANARIGSYIQVFLEDGRGWETFNTKFSLEYPEKLNLNKMLSRAYAVMGLVATVVPPMVFDKSRGFLDMMLFEVSLGLFIWALICVFKSQGKKKEYLSYWRALEQHLKDKGA